METLEADIFIIPNSLQICDSKVSDDVYDYNVTNVTGLQVCFEAWITNRDCSNWNLILYPKLGCKITSKIPIEPFIGKKEGDIVELFVNGKRIFVRCIQKKYKYNSHGAFEDLLYNLSKSFGGICPPSYYNPPLSEKSQMAFFIANHEKISRTYCKEVIDPVSFRFSNKYIEQCKHDSDKLPYVSEYEKMSCNVSC